MRRGEQHRAGEAEGDGKLQVRASLHSVLCISAGVSLRTRFVSPELTLGTSCPLILLQRRDALDKELAAAGIVVDEKAILAEIEAASSTAAAPGVAADGAAGGTGEAAASAPAEGAN